MLLISWPVLLDFDYYFFISVGFLKVTWKKSVSAWQKKNACACFFYFSSYIGVQSINNITLVSGVQQSDSVLLWFLSSLIKIFGNLFLFCYISTYLISLVLPLCPQSLKYLPCGPLHKKFANPPFRRYKCQQARIKIENKELIPNSFLYESVSYPINSYINDIYLFFCRRNIFPVSILS